MISVIEPQNKHQMESPRQSGGVQQAGAKDSVASKDSVENETSEKEDDAVPSKEGNVNTSSADGGSSIISTRDQTTEVTHSVTHVGTAARLTPPPPPSAVPHVPPSVSAAQPGRSILRRHSAYGNEASTNEKKAADDSESSDISVVQEGENCNRKPAPTSAASAASGSESLQVAAAATFPPNLPRRRSMLGVSYNGETAPLSGGDDGPPAAVASRTERAIRRHSLLGVSYNGETAPLSRGTSPRRHSIASVSSASTSASGSVSSRTTTTPRRHSMLGVAYSGMATELAGRDASTANGGNGSIEESASWESTPRNVTRRHSMLGVAYGGMTAPLELSGDDGKAARHDAPSNPMSNPNRAHRRLSIPRTTQSRAEQQRRLSIPPAEVGSSSRETIGRISRSHSLAHSSTSSVIDQTQRRPSLTEIQDFLDDDDDDDDDNDDDDDDGNDDDDGEVDLGGDGERMPSYRKAERKLSMPRAEIGAQSRETIRSLSISTMQIETRRLSLTEVQDYLDGDSSSDEEEDGLRPEEENGARANSNANNSQSRRHSIASVSSQVSQRPRSILRRHSAYGSDAPIADVPQYVRPDLIRLASLQQQTASPSVAEGNDEVRRHRSASISSAGSSVSFGSVSVRSHSQTLGDHPCCKLGPPMALDWKYQDHRPVRVDDWEKYRVREGGPNSEMMYIPPRHRRNVLEYRYGHSREETTEAARVARMARRRRSMTRTMLPMAGIEEAGETVAGFAKKVVKSGRQVVTKKKKANRRDSAHF